MPTDFTLLHGLAILMLYASWSAYSLVLRLVAKGTLNSRLVVVRQHWMQTSPRRENRVFDAMLLGHVSHALAFFGSATLLVLAGVIGMLLQFKDLHQALNLLAFIERTSLELFAIKLMVLASLVLICFFMFIYSLRKLNYTISLLAALPESPVCDEHQKRMAECTAIVFSEAMKSFNGGIRGYYLAISSLLLFVSPLACIIATVGVFTMLLLRQTLTKTANGIDAYVDALNARLEGQSKHQSKQ